MKKKKKINNNPQKEKEEKKIEIEKFSAFYNKFIANGKLIQKTATFLDFTRISYVKGKDLKQFFEENFEEIQKEILSITKMNIGKEPNEESLKKFYEINHQKQIIKGLKRIPGDKAKYPKKLLPITKEEDKKLEFSENAFYIFDIKTEKTNKPIIYLVLLIILILFIVLFPIWPLNVKLGVLYFLLACMIFLLVFLILIIVVAIIGVLIGYDILILPNLDEPKMSWKDKLFNPFIIINKREDECGVIIIRIILIIFLIALGVCGYFYPRIPKACYNFIKDMLFSLFDYGKNKIEEIHYHRNAVTVHDRNQYIEDFDGI